MAQGDAILLLLPDNTQAQAKGDASGNLLVSGGGGSSGTNVIVQQAAATTAVLTTISSVATTTTILAAATTRVAAAIYNSDANALMIKYGATAALTSFSYLIKSGETWDMPYRYTGIIDGLWAADGVGTAFITSLTG